VRLTELITLIATLLASGYVGMIIAQLIKRPAWPSSVKLLLAIIVCLAMGLAAAWLSGSVLGITAKWGSLTTADVLGFAVLVYTAAATFYHRYFGDTNWMKGLEAWPVPKAITAPTATTPPASSDSVN
jgi:hypothetical protein